MCDWEVSGGYAHDYWIGHGGVAGGGAGGGGVGGRGDGGGGVGWVVHGSECRVKDAG